MLTVVVPPLSVGDRPLSIRISRAAWMDGTRTIYRYAVVCDGATVLRGDDPRGPAAGRAPTLRAAAAALAGFLSAAGESLAGRGEASDYWCEYNPAQREFLAATYERFAALADA
jgi:hypothetical protein